MWSMTHPALALVLLTYDRPETAFRTLRAALDRIEYPGPIDVHIADDGSPVGYLDDLRQLAGGYEGVRQVGQTNAARRGYGASYNLATQVIHAEHQLVLPLEDDWELTRPLPLEPLVATLWGHYGIDCIRLGYLGFTQELRGRVVETPAGKMLLLDPDSEEPHVFTGHPRLELVDFQRRVGAWPEGLPAGRTEWEVSARPEARRGVAWPMDVVMPRGDLFVHIGTRGLGELAPEGAAVAGA